MDSEGTTLGKNQVFTIVGRLPVEVQDTYRVSPAARRDQIKPLISLAWRNGFISFR